jgi:hypothetical protein
MHDAAPTRRGHPLRHRIGRQQIQFIFGFAENPVIHRQFLQLLLAVGLQEQLEKFHQVQFQLVAAAKTQIQGWSFLYSTPRRVEASGTVLLVHDTTEMEFKGEADREGLGHLRRKPNGLLLHLSLVVSAEGLREPLGVLAARPHVRTAFRHHVLPAKPPEPCPLIDP